MLTKQDIDSFWSNLKSKGLTGSRLHETLFTTLFAIQKNSGISLPNLYALMPQIFKNIPSTITTGDILTVKACVDGWVSRNVVLAKEIGGTVYLYPNTAK